MCVYVYTNTHTQLVVSCCYLCKWFQDWPFSTRQWLNRLILSLGETNSSSSTHQLPVILGSEHFPPSIWTWLLILPLFWSCLCSHFCERPVHRRLYSGSSKIFTMSSTMFMEPKMQELWCRCAHWLELFLISWSQHHVHLCFSVIVSICYKERLWWGVVATFTYGYKDKI